MQQLKDFIESGVLELYVLGNATPEQLGEVALMVKRYPEITTEINNIENSLQEYAVQNAVLPGQIVKPFLMATVDYSERIKNGEPVSFPPVINDTTTVNDFQPWLERDDMNMPGELPDLYAKIIGYTPAMTTAIVWIKQMAPQETHHNEIEKFLIVEGTCDIIIGDEVQQLSAGDTLSIPLHKTHVVKVTSAIPCKVILQRIAA
jgi:mannose-6-phosphate isomerase-like protein (cupin superfamily)